MRKHVTPAPGAIIPDPDRGRDLPAEGLPVVWSAYWATLASRQDVTVSEIEAEAPPEPAEDDDELEPAPKRARRKG